MACNTSACIWDQVRVGSGLGLGLGSGLGLGLALTLPLTSACVWDQGDCGYTGEYAMEELCAVGCPVAWIDDGYCDEACYNDACRC